jgi:hypothetical protein
MKPDWVDLEGTANTRDTGGLPTTDGRRTVRHRLLRSDSLQYLSKADVSHLVGYCGVRTVIDLRAAIEVTAEGPGPMTREPLVTVEHRSLFPEQDDHVKPLSERLPPVGRGFAGLYLGFLLQRPDSVLAALRRIAYGAGATVVHCTAGKDRTGTVVALALAEAGVERTAIVADYAASADRYGAVLRLHAREAADGGLANGLANAVALLHAPRGHDGALPRRGGRAAGRGQRLAAGAGLDHGRPGRPAAQAARLSQTRRQADGRAAGVPGRRRARAHRGRPQGLHRAGPVGGHRRLRHPAAGRAAAPAGPGGRPAR